MLEEEKKKWKSERVVKLIKNSGSKLCDKRGGEY